MRRSDIAVSLFLIGLAGFILLQTKGLTFGNIRTPQTGFFPSLLACLLLVLSTGLLVQALRRPEASSSLWQIGAKGWQRIGTIFLVLTGFALALESVGYLISAFVLMVVLLRAIEPQKWGLVIVVAGATALATYLIFVWFLNVPLPQGFLPFC
jgi:putative tricarboxylic transport membrane protein